MALPETILVISHRRSGTHWVIDAVRHNFSAVSQSFFNMDQLMPGHNQPLSLDEFTSRVGAGEKAVLIKTHTPPTLNTFHADGSLLSFVQSLLERSRVVYVYRDGRDVLVSLYYYMRHYDPRIRDTSFSDFIRMPNDFDYMENLNRVEYWKFHVEGWLRQPNVFAVSYESLHADYEKAMKRLAQYLNLGLGPHIKPVEFSTRHPSGNVHKLLSWVLYKTHLQRTRSISAILPRKGIVGDWRRHFSDEDTRFFDHIAHDLLKELGYSDEFDIR